MVRNGHMEVDIGEAMFIHRKIDTERKKKPNPRIACTSIAVSMSWFWVIFLSSLEMGDIFLYMTNQSVWFWKCRNCLCCIK